jgi:hypothetical protein
LRGLRNFRFENAGILPQSTPHFTVFVIRNHLPVSCSNTCRIEKDLLKEQKKTGNKWIITLYALAFDSILVPNSVALNAKFTQLVIYQRRMFGTGMYVTLTDITAKHQIENSVLWLHAFALFSANTT